MSNNSGSLERASMESSSQEPQFSQAGRGFDWLLGSGADAFGFCSNSLGLEMPGIRCRTLQICLS